MRKGNVNKVLLLCVCLIFVLCVVVFLLLRKDTEPLTLEVIGNQEITLNLGSEYEELGAVVLDKGLPSNLYSVEVEGTVDINTIGVYKITYTMNDDRGISAVRTVTVIDHLAPVLDLDGETVMRIQRGQRYQEPGFKAIDNVDGDISNLVQISGEVDYLEFGAYTLIYEVSDNAGNSVTENRIVIVDKQAGIPTLQSERDKSDPDYMIRIDYDNSIQDMTWTQHGFIIKGEFDQEISSFSLVDVSSKVKNEYPLVMVQGIYTSHISLDSLENGKYQLTLNTNDTNQPVKNKMLPLYRLARAKVGDKLITMQYENDQQFVIIEDFEYLYDIYIDVGHGDDDIGASVTYNNQRIAEIDINLTVSMYEKRRFEEHGLTVRLSRESNTTDADVLNVFSHWQKIHNISYSAGYYGVRSKIVYSNHHNASINTNRAGFEIYVPAGASKLSLSNEHLLYKLWKELYPSSFAMLCRDYETRLVCEKLKGEIYNATDYYSVTRLPYNLFNVPVTMYESAYLTNGDELRWYWLDENWKQVSEAKIRVYVESLGLDYRNPSGGGR